MPVNVKFWECQTYIDNVKQVTETKVNEERGNNFEKRKRNFIYCNPQAAVASSIPGP